MTNDKRISVTIDNETFLWDYDCDSPDIREYYAWLPNLVGLVELAEIGDPGFPTDYHLAAILHHMAKTSPNRVDHVLQFMVDTMGHFDFVTVMDTGSENDLAMSIGKYTDCVPDEADAA